MRFIPNYGITLEYKESQILYYGCLIQAGTPKELNEIIDKAYNGSKAMVILPASWGGYSSNDLDICQMSGLEYANFKVINVGEEQTFFRFDGYRYIECEKVDLYVEFFEYLENNETFVQSITKFFSDATVTPGIFQV